MRYLSILLLLVLFSCNSLPTLDIEKAHRMLDHSDQAAMELKIMLTTSDLDASGKLDALGEWKLFVELVYKRVKSLQDE